MKAIVYTEYGPPDVLQLKEVEKPSPKDNEVLIKVHAASANSYDWRLLTADPFLVRLMGGGLLKPKNKTLGADIAGQVEAVGRNVTQFQPGDDVFGDISRCGCGGFAFMPPWADAVRQLIVPVWTIALARLQSLSIVRSVIMVILGMVPAVLVTLVFVR